MPRKSYKKREVPLRVRRLSRNMEHELHGEAGGCSNARKEGLAHQLQRRYGRRPEEFAAFLRSGEIAAPGDFPATWAWIQREANSLGAPPTCI